MMAPEAIAATLVDLVRERIPRRARGEPIQVLTPMNRGLLGARELNAALQQALNPLRPGEAALEKFGVAFRPRDKVIQTVNNYDKDVFNGDIGEIVAIDQAEQLTLAAGESLKVEHSLGGVYNLTSTGAGLYNVRAFSFMALPQLSNERA